MREFNYTKYKGYVWDNEMLGLVSAIHEFKGKQELYMSQKPAVLDKLMEIAKVQSTEASNEIEGIRTTNVRLKQLSNGKTTPRNRDEEEIAGYRYVLNEIHESYEYIPITATYILQLHRDMYRFTNQSLGGQFKNGQNQIVAKDAEGHEQILFTPLSAFETPEAMEEICKSFDLVIRSQEVDALIVIPIFVHDFLCIHPFNDGNGRMSRLLTTLLLYRSGYVLGKYISLEKKIAQDKELYYDALQASQDGWHEGTNDSTPFIKYLLRIIVASYKDLEDRVSIVETKQLALEQVRMAVVMKIGKFTKSEIMELCPGLSKASVENSLTKLVEEGIINRHGLGRATYYVRSDAE